MKVKTAYPLIVNNKVVANGLYESGYFNMSGRQVMARMRRKPAPKINPNESPADVQARELLTVLLLMEIK